MKVLNSTSTQDSSSSIKSPTHGTSLSERRFYFRKILCTFPDSHKTLRSHNVKNVYNVNIQTPFGVATSQFGKVVYKEAVHYMNAKKKENAPPFFLLPLSLHLLPFLRHRSARRGVAEQQGPLSVVYDNQEVAVGTLSVVGATKISNISHKRSPKNI